MIKKLVFLCLFLMQSCYALNIDKIVAFGDSLSDNGNIYSLTKKAKIILPFVPVVPKNPPYYEGRFSNGPVWLENLAVAMDVPLQDYAYGGAWAEPLSNSGLVFPFSLGSQVDMYMTSHMTDTHQADHLFVVWSGANDYLSERDDHEYATDNTIANIKKQIDWLIYYGGKTFLLPNLPDISVAPMIINDGPAAVQSARDIVALHNKKFKLMVEQEKKDNPDVTFITVDVTEYMDEVIANPTKYNLKNITAACYGGGYWLRNVKADENEVAAAKKAKIDFKHSPALNMAYLTGKLADQGGIACRDADEYMFWDQLHPTRAMHMLIAKVIMEKLQDQSVRGVRA